MIAADFGYDSAEYEYLTEAVQLSAGVEGMACEIGLRRGKGTATIIEAVLQYCPGKRVVSIDPFGSIPYEHREGQICRLDYTNQMMKETLAQMYTFISDKDVEWLFFKMTDIAFFTKYGNGVEVYELDAKLETKYSFVHLDGPHGADAVIYEAEWFCERTLSGATLVIDDFSPDFISMEPVIENLEVNGWEHIKTGNKKTLWRKR
jgi:hypothetical protein